MESSVEYGYLWKLRAKGVSAREYAFNAIGVVQWSKLGAVMNAIKNFVGDQRRIGKLLSTVDDAMTCRLCLPP